MLKRMCILFVALMLIAAAASAELSSPILLGGKGSHAIGNGDVLALSDGRLLMAIQSGGGRGDLPIYGDWHIKTWLLCLNPDGSTAWEHEYGEEQGYYNFTGLRENADGTLTAWINYSELQQTQWVQEQRFSLEDGTLLEAMEKQPADEMLTLNRYPLPGGMLLEMIYAPGPSTYPRYVQRQNEEGQTLWQLDLHELGISYLECVESCDKGTLLLGRDRETTRTVPVLALVDESGAVAWNTRIHMEIDATLTTMLLGSDGTLVACGFARQEKEDQSTNFDLVVALDSATGESRWSYCQTPPNQGSASTRTVAEADEGYVFGGIRTNYSGTEYLLLSRDGAVLSSWDTLVGNATAFGPQLVNWAGDVWNITFVEKDDLDQVKLERVALP